MVRPIAGGCQVGATPAALACWAPMVRGGAAGVRALLKQARAIRIPGSLAKAAERFLRRQVELEDAYPFHAAPAARAEHAARMSEAQVALREGPSPRQRRTRPPPEALPVVPPLVPANYKSIQNIRRHLVFEKQPRPTL